MRLPAFAMALLLVLLHHCACGNLLLAAAVAALLLPFLLDVLVLPLLSFTDAAQVLLLRHLRTPFVSRSAGLADCLDQIPLAHLRAAGDVLVLRDLVQLLAVPILQRATGLATALATPSRLLAQLAARALRQPGDRALAFRRLLGLFDVSFRRLDLARRSHFTHLHLVVPLEAFPWGAGLTRPALAFV